MKPKCRTVKTQKKVQVSLRKIWKRRGVFRRKKKNSGNYMHLEM